MPKMPCGYEGIVFFVSFMKHKGLIPSQKPIKLLHFAPEREVSRYLLKQSNLSYTTCDLLPPEIPQFRAGRYDRYSV